MENIEDKRIAVLLSGGVDSSVVVYELARQGLHPDCFYIKIGPEEQEEWDCNSEEDMEMATVVAQRYGCRLEVVDCHREYWDQVTRYTMEKVRAGFTPNPDVMCNRLIKFGAFDEKRGHDYDLIATGHYAQTEWIDGRKWLTTSPDPVKDQTDFLAQIHPWQLKKALFPLVLYHLSAAVTVRRGGRLVVPALIQQPGFAGNLLPGQYRLQRVCAPLSRRAARRYHRARDGAHYRTAQGSMVSYHRTAEGSRTGGRTVVCHPQGRGAEHPLRLPRLRPGDGL